MGEAVLAGVSTKDPRINDWLTLRSHCWSLWAEALNEERDWADIGVPSYDTVTATYDEYSKACDDSSNKRQALEKEAGIH